MSNAGFKYIPGLFKKLIRVVSYILNDKSAKILKFPYIS